MFSLKYLTQIYMFMYIYIFGTDNWKRHQAEIFLKIFFLFDYHIYIYIYICIYTLQLIDKHFPRSSKLNSYSCTPSLQKVIKRRNKKLAAREERKTAVCNCRRKQECPMQDKCRAESSLYKCDSKFNNISPKSHFGTSEVGSKTRSYTMLNLLETCSIFQRNSRFRISLGFKEQKHISSRITVVL